MEGLSDGRPWADAGWVSGVGSLERCRSLAVERLTVALSALRHELSGCLDADPVHREGRASQGWGEWVRPLKRSSRPLKTLR